MTKYNNIKQIRIKYVHILNTEGLEETNYSDSKDIKSIITEVCDFIKEIVVEDVPHQYQERLLRELNSL